MRLPSLLITCLTAASCLMAQSGPQGGNVALGEFMPATNADIDRAAAVYAGPQTKVAGWIWTDKYTYQVGQSLTLKATVKTNGDLYPYTAFLYRQNNQTGAKTYYPKGTAEVTDISGNNQATGFQPTVIPSQTKAVLLGNGGVLGPAVLITGDLGLGMHTFVLQLRDYTGTRVLKTSYFKFGIVNGITTISTDVTTDTTWTNDKEWDLKGGIHVTNGATLTIQPGTFVVGLPGSTPPSFLLVTQNGKINTNGTASRPIIMTSSLPFGSRSRGDWGGLILLGKAPINVGANIVGGATCGTTGCNNQAGTFFIEGLVADPTGLYGGNDPTHNCGSLKYVRVEYAGTILSSNNELNSITWGGCGTQTVAEHLQTTYGKDDAFEWFGGTMNAKWLIGSHAADDFTDWQLGFTGKLQFVVGLQSPDAKGNRGIEADNSEYDAAAVPFSNPTVFNATYIGSGNPGFDEASSPGIFLRRATRGSINNTVVTNFYSGCFDVDDATTQAQTDAGNVKLDGILCYNNNLGAVGGPVNTADGQAATPAATGSLAYTVAFMKGTNAGGNGKNFIFNDPLLTRPFEYSDPDFTGRFSSPLFRAGAVQPPDDGFFDQTAQYLGAFGDVNWTEEWTSFIIEADF